MTTLSVSIETVLGDTVSFSESSEDWEGLSTPELDDVVTSLVNQNNDAQAVIANSNGYTQLWHSD